MSFFHTDGNFPVLVLSKLEVDVILFPFKIEQSFILLTFFLSFCTQRNLILAVIQRK